MPRIVRHIINISFAVLLTAALVAGGALIGTAVFGWIGGVL